MDGVTPSAINRIEADREVEDAEREGATFWRLAGAVPGQRSRFVDETLREKLVEALATLRALDESTIRSAISECAAEVGRLDHKRSLGDDFEDQIAKASDSDPEKWPERALDLIDALAEKVADQSDEIALLKKERSEAPAPPPSNVRILRPGLRKGKPKLGSTTLALPGLEVPEPVVRGALPIGKVEGVADPGKKKRGRPKKAVDQK